MARKRGLSPKALLTQRLRDKALSPKAAALATFFLDQYQKAAFMTAAEVARHLGISPATVVRFAASLGYDGYPALRRHLHEVVQQDLTGTDLFARHLKHPEPDVLHSTVEREIGNLYRLVKDVSLDDLDRLAGRIAGAGHVVVIGHRASGALVRYFAYHLAKIHPRVVTISDWVEPPFDALAGRGENDVLVAIGYPRYARETLRLLEVGRRRGFFIGVITDSVLSPLAKRADVAIPVRAEVVSFLDSFCAPQVVLTALLAQTSEKNQARTEGRLRHFEEAAGDLGLFHPSD